MRISASELQQYALDYIWQGFSVFPARRKFPLSKKLIPSGWTPYQTNLPTDAEIAQWPWHAADGIALIIGPATYAKHGCLWLLDIEAEHRREAEQWLDANVSGWRDGMNVESGSLGLHLYCEASQPVATVPGIPWGDIKADRALGYLPPTRYPKHPHTGNLYRWLSQGKPIRLEPNRVPGVDFERPPVRAIIESAPITEKNPGRNQTLFRLGCNLRGNGFDPATIAVVLHAVNQERCEPPLDRQEVDKIAISIGERYRPNPFLTRATDRPIYRRTVTA